MGLLTDLWDKLTSEEWCQSFSFHASLIITLTSPVTFSALVLSASTHPFALKPWDVEIETLVASVGSGGNVWAREGGAEGAPVSLIYPYFSVTRAAESRR